MIFVLRVDGQPQTRFATDLGTSRKAEWVMASKRHSAEQALAACAGSQHDLCAALGLDVHSRRIVGADFRGTRRKRAFVLISITALRRRLDHVALSMIELRDTAAPAWVTLSLIPGRLHRTGEEDARRGGVQRLELGWASIMKPSAEAKRSKGCQLFQLAVGCSPTESTSISSIVLNQQVVVFSHAYNIEYCA